MMGYLMGLKQKRLERGVYIGLLAEAVFRRTPSICNGYKG